MWTLFIIVSLQHGIQIYRVYGSRAATVAFGSLKSHNRNGIGRNVLLECVGWFRPFKLLRLLEGRKTTNLCQNMPPICETRVVIRKKKL